MLGVADGGDDGVVELASSSICFCRTPFRRSCAAWIASAARPCAWFAWAPDSASATAAEVPIKSCSAALWVLWSRLWLIQLLVSCDIALTVAGSHIAAPALGIVVIAIR